MLKKIDHIGIAAPDLRQAMPFFGGALCLTFAGIEEVAGYRVRVAFFQIGESKIELLEPMDDQSFLAAFLAEKGAGIHHVAYQVQDLEAAIAKLEADGVEMIDKTPRQGAHGARVAFLRPESSHGVLTELCQPGPVPRR